jgi:hypothetical protein
MHTIVRLINWACVLAALAVPALLAVNLFKIAASGGPRQASLIFKAAAALAVWVIASVGLLLVTFVAAYATHGFYQSAGWRPTPGYFGLHLGYLLIGGGLVYWVWRQARIKLP